MACNRFFNTLGILASCLSNKCLEKTTLSKSTLPPSAYKTSLDTSPSQKLLSLHCRQINGVTNELDEKPSRLLACMKVLYKAALTELHLVFLEQDTHYCNPGIKLLVESKNVIIKEQIIKTMSI